MLKKIVASSFLLASSLLSTLSLAATNQCIANLDEHVWGNMVELFDCNLQDADIPQLVTFLNEHPEIEMVFAPYNHIAEGAIPLAHVATLKVLYLAGNQINDAGAKALAMAPNLTLLEVSSNRIHDKGAEALAKSSSLQGIGIANNPITNEGAFAIANMPLDVLYFSANSLSYETMVALATNSHLQYVGIINTQLRNKDIRTLTQSTHLYGLIFDHVDFTNAGIKALTEDDNISILSINGTRLSASQITMLMQNKNLKGLQLVDDNLHDEVFGNFATMELAMLDLSDNNLTNKTAVSIASNTQLQALILEKNQIGDDGAIALAANTTLQYLNVVENPIGTAGYDALAKSTIPNIDTSLPYSDDLAAHKRVLQNHCFEKGSVFCQKLLGYVKK
ncbi:MAG: hypothetical protein ABI597_13775 [Gammaproteobacteria bacterium]